MAECDTVDDPGHAWNRFLNVWRWIFWGFVLLLLVYLVALSGEPHRWLGVAAVAVLGLTFAVARPAPTFDGTWRNRIYVAVAVVAVGVAIYADPTSFVLLFITNAQMWIYSSGPRRGVPLVLALALSSSVGFVAGQGWSTDAALGVAPSMIISVAFSILMGVWINRIIDQSLERAGLIRDLTAARLELESAHHAAGVLAERERMAREIHDTLAQGYTSVIMLAQGAALDPTSSGPALAQIEAVARENLAEARALVAALSPVGLSDSTLIDAIRRLASRFASSTGVDVSLDLPPSLAGLARDREVVLLRAVQEALTNVRRHAGATSVTVRVALGSDAAAPVAASAAPTAAPAAAPVVTITVQDDGVGISGTPEGFGLSGMRSRVAEAGGSMDVDSAPGAGTTIHVRVPGAAGATSAPSTADRDPTTSGSAGSPMPGVAS